MIESICLFVELLGAARGVTPGWVFSLVLAAILIVFIREIVRINDILAELKERIGMDSGSKGKARGRRKPSLLLSTGMIMNGIVLLLPETGRIRTLGLSYEALKISCQMVAIAMIVAGIVRTFRRIRE